MSHRKLGPGPLGRTGTHKAILRTGESHQRHSKGKPKVIVQGGIILDKKSFFAIEEEKFLKEKPQGDTEKRYHPTKPTRRLTAFTENVPPPHP